MERKITGFNAAMKKVEAVPYQLKQDLMDALGITSRQQLHLIQTGRCRLTKPKQTAVKLVFEKYGIDDPFDYMEVGG